VGGRTRVVTRIYGDDWQVQGRLDPGQLLRRCCGAEDKRLEWGNLNLKSASAQIFRDTAFSRHGLHSQRFVYTISNTVVHDRDARDISVSLCLIMNLFPISVIWMASCSSRIRNSSPAAARSRSAASFLFSNDSCRNQRTPFRNFS
jgi:hypothetical protein